MIDVISDVTGEKPVVGAVTEQIANGHGGVRESVDEKRLENTLRIVGDPAYCGNTRKDSTIIFWQSCYTDYNQLTGQFD